MRDASKAFRKYVFEIISGLGIRVYNKIPDSAEYPLVLIGSGTSSPDNDKTVRGFNAELQLEIISRYDRGFGTDAENDDIADQIYTALFLSPYQPTEIDNGYYISYIEPSNSIDIPDEDDTFYYARRIVTSRACIFARSIPVISGLSYTNDAQGVPVGDPITPMVATVTASGNGGAPTYVFSSLDIPASLVLDPATGQITGSLDAEGTYEFTVTVVPGNADVLGSASVNLTVTTSILQSSLQTDLIG